MKFKMFANKFPHLVIIPRSFNISNIYCHTGLNQILKKNLKNCNLTDVQIEYTPTPQKYYRLNVYHLASPHKQFQTDY